jgi:diguanylate cyclase (GGDEF)-like protein
MKTVRQVMATDVATVDAGRTVADAVALMLERDVNALPVMESGRLVGLITMRELLRALPYRPVREVMQRDVNSVSSHTPIASAFSLMEGRRVSQLPVVDEGEIVGMVTTEAILRALDRPLDPLTELPWAISLRERAVEYLKAGREIAIIFLDLDNFGQVNKQLGHVVGDNVIKAIARALQSITDSAFDLLCRYAGDEFAILTARRRDQAEALGRRAVEVIGALAVPGAAPDFRISAAMGIAGGKRTTERQDVHFEATVDDLITLASRQTTQVKAERARRAGIGTAGAALREPRLYLRRVTLTSQAGQLMAEVELGLGADRFAAQAQGPDLGEAAVQLLAGATAQAINRALPDGWRCAVAEVQIERSSAGTQVTVVVDLGYIGGMQDRQAGLVLAGQNVTTAVAKATLRAVNRRLGLLLKSAAPLR